MEKKEIKRLLGIMFGASLLLSILYSPWLNKEDNLSVDRNVKYVNSSNKFVGFTVQQTNYMYNMIVGNSQSFLYDMTINRSLRQKGSKSGNLVEAGGYIVGIYNAKKLNVK